MHYMFNIHLPSDTLDERTARFLETGGLPPTGVTMHARWHSLGLDQVFVHVESDDPAAIYRYAAMWADVLEIEVVPVIEDAEAAAVLQSLSE